MNELPKVQTKTNTEGSVLFFNSLDEINKYLMINLFIQFIRFSYYNILPGSSRTYYRILLNIIDKKLNVLHFDI